MTFSLAARDPATGAFGMVMSSSSLAVASRCLHLRTGVGAVASQNVTNPELGPRVLEALAVGASAQDALATAIAAEEHPEYRQLTAVDARGRVAHHSGARVLGHHGVALGDQAIAAGNLLASPLVVDAMLDAFLASDHPSLEERLLAALFGALAAGGEEGPVRSAGLSVVEGASWRTTDLRVDDFEDPAAELTRLVSLWLPQKDAYLVRAIDPAAAASYGVPGDA